MKVDKSNVVRFGLRGQVAENTFMPGQVTPDGCKSTRVAPRPEGVSTPR